MAPMAREPGQKGVNWSNIAVGAIMNMDVPFSGLCVTTLGQPLEVIKTQMAANRSQTMLQALRTVWSRGGVSGFYQGLIPWAWIEASTKGAVLLFTASEIESAVMGLGINQAAAGLVGGMGGGIAQAYATMGFCTCMKTAEITRHKQAAAGIKPPSTWAVFADIYRREGLAGINKGLMRSLSVNVLIGDLGWDSLDLPNLLFVRFEEKMRRRSLPIEVVRVEMQSMAKGASANRPEKLTILNTLSYIYKENGIKGLYRGVTPRIGLGIWQTVCMVSFADYVKAWVKGN
ncbi:mitochondrial carrier [Pyrrhoderma noxium]|uniref:Mitochondrial carrier n=1 Tax=Pyrrhoderma noxium TaxID=2282107 RepID=A0A286URU4_9AGAM|nr:mitochondrial carrier [Pyrrhoderma noxium]